MDEATVCPPIPPPPHSSRVKNRRVLDPARKERELKISGPGAAAAGAGPGSLSPVPWEGDSGGGGGSGSAGQEQREGTRRPGEGQGWPPCRDGAWNVMQCGCGWHGDGNVGIRMSPCPDKWGQGWDHDQTHGEKEVTVSGCT